MASSAVFGEAAVEVAAVEEFVDDLRDDEAQGAAAGLVVARAAFDEGCEVAVGAWPKGRAARVAGAANSGGMFWVNPAYMDWNFSDANTNIAKLKDGLLSRCASALRRRTDPPTAS